MKKIYTDWIYKQKHKRKSAKLWRRRLKSKNKHTQQFISKKGLSVRYGAQVSQHYSKVLTAPSNFCIKENPNEVVRFINRLNKCVDSRTSVFINLERIVSISHDAIVILLSLKTQFKALRIPFNGNFPIDQVCSLKLRQSGFFSNLYDSKTIIRYDTSASSKNIIRKHGKETHGNIAKELIKICSMNIWNQECRCQGVYRILLELMQNTHAHACVEKEGGENWWLSVNYDPDKNKECFSFVDYGVGVFKSLMNKKAGNKFFGALDTIRQKLLEPNNAKILNLILEGELHRTSTGHYYRGKGLPGIKTALERNQIDNLYIITNDAYGNVCKNKFVTLQHSFNGTFIYWELTSNNINCHG